MTESRPFAHDTFFFVAPAKPLAGYIGGKRNLAQRLSFGGKIARRVFGVDKTSPARFDLTKLVPMLEAVHEHLADVVIERLPWQDFIVRYDHPGMLFFMDPPYWGNEKDYGAGTFSRAAFGEMADSRGFHPFISPYFPANPGSFWRSY